MPAFSAPDLAVLAGVAIIIGGFALAGFVKGLARMLFGLLSLAGGVIAGYWGLQKGASIAATIVSSPEPWMSGLVGVILGLAVFFVARALFSVLLSPITVKDGKRNVHGLLGGLAGFLMGALFAWCLLSGIRYVGTLAELDWIKTSVGAQGKVTKAAQPLFARIKRLVDHTLLGSLHENYDLLNNRARTNLAKLTVLADNKVAVTTAATDKPVRDAVLQEDINRMLKEQSADLRSFINDRQYAHLLQAKPIKEVSKKQQAQTALKAIDVEKSLGLVEQPPE